MSSSTYGELTKTQVQWAAKKMLERSTPIFNKQWFCNKEQERLARFPYQYVLKTVGSARKHTRAYQVWEKGKLICTTKTMAARTRFIETTHTLEEVTRELSEGTVQFRPHVR